MYILRYDLISFSCTSGIGFDADAGILTTGSLSASFATGCSCAPGNSLIGSFGTATSPKPAAYFWYEGVTFTSGLFAFSA